MTTTGGPAGGDAADEAPALPDYALSADVAQARAKRWASEDPFPAIPSALLNAADIQDYVAATGMIVPFNANPAKEKLKAASYEVDLLGKYVYYDGEGNERSDVIKRGDPFVLEANSIAFVTLEPEFILPDYIALRFNLRITHVYRGLLLGTGPLIDPGFQGRLSIPLHNLTTNDYRLTGGEGLIWVEFTKLSPEGDSTADPSRPPAGAPPRLGRRHVNKGFEEKKGSGVSDYLRKAEPYRPIRSGIPAATKDAQLAAQQARDTTKGFRTLVTLAGAAFLVGLISLVIGLVSLLNGIGGRLDNIDRTDTEIADLRSRLDDLESRPPTAGPPAPVPTP